MRAASPVRQREGHADQRERKAIKRSYVASFMSDTKWRKLFLALDRPELNLSQCVVKFVGVPDAKTMDVPKRHALWPPHGYVDTLQFGPVTLRSIEWIEFPRALMRKRYPGDAGVETLQDIEGIRLALEKLGRFPLEDSPAGLRVIGHQPATLNTRGEIA
jgi:hypothetical protein